MTAILLITFLVLMLLNVPIAFCMLLSSLLTLLVADINPIMMTLETTRSLSNFYSFLAVPFFILAGEIMSVGGLSSRLIDVVKAFLGHKRNGLPFVSVISSQLFGAVSGASAATCAAIGSMMVPALEKNKYPRPFATALVACAGTTGALIPPSIPLLLYGTIANVSIEKLFIAGVIPGILVGGGIMLMASHLARKFDITKENKANWKEKLRASSKAIWVLILMLIIFGGIMGGIFTATEASAVAVVYALLVSLFIYKEIKLKDLPKVFLNACKTTAALSFLLACASLFAWVLSIGKMPEVICGSFCDKYVHRCCSRIVDRSSCSSSHCPNSWNGLWLRGGAFWIDCRFKYGNRFSDATSGEYSVCRERSWQGKYQLDDPIRITIYLSDDDCPTFDNVCSIHYNSASFTYELNVYL